MIARARSSLEDWDDDGDGDADADANTDIVGEALNTDDGDVCSTEVAAAVAAAVIAVRLDNVKAGTSSLRTLATPFDSESLTPLSDGGVINYRLLRLGRVHERTYTAIFPTNPTV